MNTIPTIGIIVVVIVALTIGYYLMKPEKR